MAERCAPTGAWLHDVHDSMPIPIDECREYVCCGIALPDLHALIEHFESHHAEVICPPTYDLYTPSSSDADSPPFDADDMNISANNDLPLAPDHSPLPPHHTSKIDPVCVTVDFRTRSPQQLFPISSYSSLSGANGPIPLNRCAENSQYFSALTHSYPSPAHARRHPVPHQDEQLSRSSPRTVPCVSPSLIFSFSSSASRFSTTTPASSVPHFHSDAPRQLPISPSILPPTNPFRCPYPSCKKSYKQRNGLKYHLEHGKCPSTAEERRRFPYACAVSGECCRRFKNMSSLKCHYNNTGKHGARGLKMLAQGTHPIPDLSATSSANITPYSSTPLQLHTPIHAPSPLVPFPVLE